MIKSVKLMSLLLAAQCTIGSNMYAAWEFPPTDLSTTGNFFINSPNVTIDSNGNATAVWSDTEVYSSTHPFGGAWSAPVGPISVLGTNTGQSSIGVNSSGDVVNIWVANTSPSSVRAARSLFSTSTWTPTDGTLISTSTSSNNAIFSMAPSGNGVALWTQDDGVNDQIYYSHYVFTTDTWAVGGFITSGSDPRAAPKIAVASSGNGIGVWQMQSSPSVVQAGIYTSSLDSWSIGPISDGVFNSGNPDIACDPAHNGVAVWVDSEITDLILKSASYTASTFTWSSPISVTSTGSNASQPQVGVDAAGNALAIWVSETAGAYTVQGARLPFGSNTWSTPVTISAPGTGGGMPSISVNASGEAIAAWPQFSGSGVKAQASLYNPTSGTWSAPTDLSTLASFTLLFVQTAIDPTGNAVATWTWKDGTDAIAQATYYTAPLTPAAPNPPASFTGETKKNRFMTQTEIYNTLAWKPSTDPLAVGYKLYLNENLVNTFGTSPPYSYTQHNTLPNVVYSYKLVSVDADGNESTPLFVTL